ncbi:DNA polymerase III subunit chi [Ostreiculturibacter nitratireducens]|uniref:DNA polymerase III subunit chi n=1 Tax=Ostreiculturibacter nitratireducens TaxID=3075226 RepID=UPI0031B5DE6E
MPATAMFYHLTRSPVEATLPMLLQKSLDAGWRVVVRGRDTARMSWLDEKLWLAPEEGFMPHGLAGGAHDALQPVLLTCAREMPNRPACLISVDGAEVSADEGEGLERLCVLFDGNDDASLSVARAQWKMLTGAGMKAQYWSEESGRWQLKTER